MQQKDKVKKIVKFEKIMKRFCKDIGVDKKILLQMFLGGGNNNGANQGQGLESNSNAKNESGKKGMQMSRDSAESLNQSNAITSN